MFFTTVCHVNVLLNYFVDTYKLYTNAIVGMNKFIQRENRKTNLNFKKMVPVSVLEILALCINRYQNMQYGTSLVNILKSVAF